MYFRAICSLRAVQARTVYGPQLSFCPQSHVLCVNNESVKITLC